MSTVNQESSEEKMKQILKQESAETFCEIVNNENEVQNLVVKKTFRYTWVIIDFELGETYQSTKFTLNDKNNCSLIFNPNASNLNYYSFGLSLSSKFDMIIDGRVPLLNTRIRLSIIDDMKMVRNVYEYLLPRLMSFERYVLNFVRKDDLLNKNNNLLSNGKLSLSFEIYFDNKNFSMNLDNLGEQPHLKECINYEKLLESKKFSDIKLIVGDKEVNAHKCILAARSEYFAAMFDHDVKETRENTIEITDFSYEVMMEVLRFIYSRKVNNFEALALDLLKAADKYQIDQLKEHCENKLINDLNLENIDEMLHIIDLHNSARLKKCAYSFFNMNIISLIKKETFNSALKLLSSNMLVELYTSAINNLLFK